MITRATRRLALAATLVGAGALALQFALTLQLVQRQGAGVTRALWIYLDYFTILTNALGTLSLALIAAGRSSGLLARTEDRTAIATSLLVVAAVYNLVLRQTWHPEGWARVADELLHVAIPLAYLLVWWSSRQGAAMARTRLLGWMTYPLGYLAYALARGAIDGRYPYPFLNVAALGWPRVLVHAALVGLAFLGVGAALAAMAHRRAAPEPISGRAGPP